MSKRLLSIACCLAAALAACKSAEPFEGLAPATQTGGPRVLFDLARTPFPEVPFPNDVLTRVDPSSATGVRVNTSLVAPSQLERDLHGRLDTLDGFGTFAPITVSFDADIDVADLLAHESDPDPANHAVHLVEIESGKEWPIDFTVGPHGHFPNTLFTPPGTPYFLNDPFAAETNLLFPTSGPFANLLHPFDPGFAASHGGVAQQDEDLLGFYERSTHTLILRPVVPLLQETRYAVLLTNRLRDASTRAVVAPGSGINHPGQTNELKPVLSHLPPGVELTNIAYAWAFTTQTVTRELEAVVQGLNSTGRLVILGNQYPLQVSAPDFGQGAYRTVMLLSPAHDPTAQPPPNPFDVTSNLYRVTASELLSFLSDPAVAKVFGSPAPPQMAALTQTFEYVNYVVQGTYTSPSFLDSTDQSPQDTSFRIDLNARTAGVVGRQVPFFIAVPKSTALHQPPFPTVIVGHGFGSSRAVDMLGVAGTFAKFGLATVSIDAFGHGLALDAASADAFRAAGSQRGIGAFANALLQGRARDLDNDGVVDPGADFFGANLFHARDVLRQSVVDWFQLTRLLRTFDGTGVFLFFVDPAGSTRVYSLAGDFDGDGVPDLGGLPTFPSRIVTNTKPPVVLFPAGARNPGSDAFVFGQSLGGILAGIAPAVDPSIRGAAVVGGGGLTDFALRTTLQSVMNSFLLPMFGPFVATCPYSVALGRCAPGEADAQPTLVMVVPDLDHPERHLPVAKVALHAGDKVSVRNLAQLPADAACSGDPLQGCATGTADANGNVRIPFSADGAVVTVGVNPPAVVVPGNALQIEIESPAGNRVIDRWEFDNTFHGVAFRSGDQLSAASRGFGRTRNTPQFRRLIQLAQTILEPADPINYARYYLQDQLPTRQASASITGQVAAPSPTLIVSTAGDPVVPVSSAVALARAAGFVETTKPDPDYGIPIDQVLIDAGVVEGVARTQRFTSATFGPRATLAGHVRCDGDCTGPVVVDPSGYSCDDTGGNCSDDLNAPRLDPPLRQQLLKPTTLLDGTTVLSGLLLPYQSRTGQHGFSSPQPQKPFDVDRYLANLIGRYFETKGHEVRFDPCQAAKPVDPVPECPWMARPPP